MVKRFTISQMIQAASISFEKHDSSLLQQASSTGNLKGIEKLLPQIPEVFPRYVPGSSCPQKGQEHNYFKKGTRDLCAKCGSSRRSRL